MIQEFQFISCVSLLCAACCTAAELQPRGCCARCGRVVAGAALGETPARGCAATRVIETSPSSLPFHALAQQERVGASRTEQEQAGAGRSEQEQAGSTSSQQGRAGVSKSKLEREGASRIEQEQAGPSRTEQEQAGASRTEEQERAV